MHRGSVLAGWACVAATLCALAGPAEATDLTEAIERVAPSVVTIRATRDVSAARGRPGVQVYPDADPYFFKGPQDLDNLFRQRIPARPRPHEGSGVVIDGEGHVLTARIVVAGAKALRVTTADGSTYAATLKGIDEATGLAVLQIEDAPEGLEPAEFGDSGGLRVGQPVFAVGSAMGYAGTVTTGIVSGLGRTVRDAGQVPLTQVDAAMHAGMSGGPVCDAGGRVIGIALVGTGSTGGQRDMGFAIPIDAAKPVIEDLIAGREVQRGYLGVFFKDLTPELAEAFGYVGEEGALVEEVLEGSPADAAGLEAGDIVVAVGGRRVKNGMELKQAVTAMEPGQAAAISVWREGKELELQATLGDLAAVREEGTGWLGLSVHALTRRDAEALGAPGLEGVQVDKVSEDSPVAKVLEADDVIIAVGRADVANVQEYLAQMGRVAPGQLVRLYVRDHRTGRLVFLTVRRPEQDEH